LDIGSRLVELIQEASL